ncbi:hypothetical protein [Pseudomonas paracarnis]|uniref:hypothetical protein n=1 Tax=Pseudomonas paracarnis TaxID=2750625 RepID=UPI0023DED688|nr:hypothetical protein [Pseudomonas paracarnis]MDF3188051.1 hypothetical protein [Pseudomonas paracarnis]
MIDYTELKRLAEAATAGPWVHGGNWVSTERGNSVADCPRGDEKFIAAANPSAVLALIAENERLAKQWGDRPAYRTPEYESKRDAMWRRAHMVATSKGYDHINMAIAAAPSACADCMGCGGEWQGEGIPNSVCETCKGSRGKVLEEERDQLRAEVAGLKTGYGAYERVNAELKAECDLLRKLASDTGQELRKASSWICREVEAGTKSATHWAVRLREKADQIDAAMGKGEQS